MLLAEAVLRENGAEALLIYGDKLLLMGPYALAGG